MDEEEFRLSWEGPTSAAAGRSIPEGSYEVSGYRIGATDDLGVEWFLAATQPFMREIEVIEGETLHVEIDPRVHLALDSTETRANVKVHGDDDAGMTIYRDGRRLPLDVRVATPDGTTVTQASFEYG